LGDIGVDGMIVIYIKETGCEIAVWIHVAKGRVQSRTGVNASIRIPFP